MAARSLILVLSLALAAPVGFAQEPSLAELAKREKKRRKATAGATRTITEAELKKPSTGTFSAPEGPAAGSEAATGTAPAAGTAPGAAPGASPEKTEDELRTERQDKWRQDLQKARDDLAKAQDQVAKLEAALGDTSQNVYSASRANRVAALEQARAQLTAAQARVEDLETTGRQYGYR